MSKLVNTIEWKTVFLAKLFQPAIGSLKIHKSNYSYSAYFQKVRPQHLTNRLVYANMIIGLSVIQISMRGEYLCQSPIKVSTRACLQVQKRNFLTRDSSKRNLKRSARMQVHLGFCTEIRRIRLCKCGIHQVIDFLPFLGTLSEMRECLFYHIPSR